MGKMSAETKRILFILLMIVVGSIVVIVYLSNSGNTDQVYNDIIAEWTSRFSSNKSAERNLLFLLILAGIAVYGFFYFVSSYRKQAWQEKENAELKQSNHGSARGWELICAILAIAVANLLVFKGTYPMLACVLLYAAILYIVDRTLLCSGVCIYFLNLYSIIGLYRIYLLCGGGRFANNITMISWTAFIMAILPLCFKNKKRLLLHLGLIDGVIVPATLLGYLSDKYEYNDEIIKITVPVSVKLVVFIVMTAFVLEGIALIVKNWRTADKIDVSKIITMGSCTCIMSANRFSGSGVIMPTDVHHPFENIIGFSQMFELGQEAFEEYIPISGMYSIVQGAIFSWFGEGGTLANYNITNNLFYLFVIIIIVALLRKEVDNVYVLLISLILYIQDYNRVVFMLPIMLLLIYPKLIENKNLWLQIYFLTSLFQGLYYPLYGAATCVAFMPFGIWQVVTYIRSGKLKKDVCGIKFWVTWGGCLLLLLLCFKYLMGTLKHMLAMSGQSVLADGISRFGQKYPSWFFPYLSDGIRLGLYDILSVMIPVSFVWIAFAMMLNVKSANAKESSIMMSVVIMPIICFTFTFTRLDVDSIYARSAGVLYTGAIVLLILAWRHISSMKVRLFLIAVLVSIPSVEVLNVGMFRLLGNVNLAPYYTVPEGYEYVENGIVEKLGTGFVEQNEYATILDIREQFENKDTTLSYMGDPEWFGYYYLLEIKGDGAMELANTVKSLSAVEETIDIARANGSVIAPSFTPYYNYYLYHWLLASGEYIWNEDSGDFYPNDGTYTSEEVIEQHKNISISWDEIDIGKTACSWGLSMDSLEDIFTQVNVDIDFCNIGNSTVLNFEQSIDGDTADFVYLEFGGMDQEYQYSLYDNNGEELQEGSSISRYLMKKVYNPNMTVQILWADDNGEIHTMKCDMSKGKLLLPLGAGLKWLFNQHEYVEIKVFQDGKEIAVPEISDIKFLKCREAGQ